MANDPGRRGDDAMSGLRIAIAARTSGECGIRDYAERLAARLPPDIEVRWIDLGACASRADLRRAARRANEADAVHVHYEYPLFGRVSPLCNRYAAFMRGLAVPSVATLHNMFPRLWRGGRALLRSGPAGWLRQALYLPFLPTWKDAQYRLAALSIAHTAAIARRAARAVGTDRVWLTPLPVPSCGTPWEPRPRASGEFRMVTPGFIKEHKGYEDALALFEANPGWTWTLAGGPQDAQDRAFLGRLKARIAACGCSGRVRITGYLPADELERVTRDADAALYPFRHATGSASAALALGLGMPIFASGIPSMRELAEAGAGLVLLDPSDPARWPEAARRPADDAQALTAMAGRNRAFARDHGYDALARRLAGWFEDARRRARAGRAAS